MQKPFDPLDLIEIACLCGRRIKASEAHLLSAEGAAEGDGTRERLTLHATCPDCGLAHACRVDRTAGPEGESVSAMAAWTDASAEEAEAFSAGLPVCGAGGEALSALSAIEDGSLMKEILK
jgi:hypothetical protein